MQMLILENTEGKRRRGVTEDEILRWHHWLNGHEFEQTPLGDSEGQGSLVCCSWWGHKESDSFSTGQRQQHIYALQADSLLSEPPGKPLCVCVCVCVCIITIYIYIYSNNNVCSNFGSRNWGRNVIGKSNIQAHTKHIQAKDSNSLKLEEIRIEWR